MLVEPYRVLTDRVDDDGACAKLHAASHAPPESVNEQVAAERFAVLGAIERQACEQDDRDGVGHTSAEPWRRVLMRDGTHRQRVVADHLIASAYDVRSRRPCSSCNPRRALEPLVQLSDAAVELAGSMVLAERLDRAQRLGGHRSGIGLASVA